MSNITKIKSDELTKLVFFTLICSQLVFNNGIYLFLCFSVLFILLYKLNQPYKPSVFSVFLLQHILQVIAGVWLANYLDNDINYRSSFTGKATILSLVGIVFLFAPIIYQQNNLKKLSLAKFRTHAQQLSTGKILNCYLISLVFTSTLAGLAFIFSGLTQVILSVVKIKWFFFLLFGYQVFLKNEKKTIFYLLVAFEFISGFYSFFSEFKTVIYYLAVLLMGFIATINFRQLVIGFVVLFFLAFLGIMWTSIKSEYRAFLNKGKAEQSTSVSKDDAMGKLLELSSENREKGDNGAVKAFLERIQYTYHFAKTIETVPEKIPFQNGSNWMESIEFATTPRFLNPDKPVIDNSAKTTKYTGIRYLGTKQGVSFSLGYFAEFYIDFGPYLMMGGLFLLGLVYSLLYKYFLNKPSSNAVFNYALAGAFFFEFYNFEMDGTYLVGRFFASLLTFGALLFFFKKSLLNYIVEKSSKQEADVA